MIYCFSKFNTRYNTSFPYALANFCCQLFLSLKLLFIAIRRRLRRPTGNKLQQETTAVSDSTAAATSAVVDMETSASVNKFKIRNRTATRKSGTDVSTEKHATTAKDNQDEGGYKVRQLSPRFKNRIIHCQRIFILYLAYRPSVFIERENERYINVYRILFNGFALRKPYLYIISKPYKIKYI